MSDVLNLFQTPQLSISQTQISPWIRRWLIFVATMIFAMVIVGGATRLTNSGLSITEWQPLLGTIPPLTSADWQIAFEKYMQTPQYKIQNLGMDMASFQFIYWWEWSHRLLGRAIGMVFLVPFLFFAATGQLTRRLWPRLALLFVLGGLQGALGWYMVSSGLVDRVDVSQYRLAAHLTLAVVLFAAIVWIVFGLNERHSVPRGGNAWVATLLFVLVIIQIAAGGFVAGIDAGQGYNTWPLMDGQFLPSGLSVISPAWRNLFENALTVQFNHRILAYIILAVATVHALRSFTSSSTLVLAAVFGQACLGILTLLLHVPLTIALMHQGGALVVVTAILWNLHKQTSVETSLT